MLVEQALAHEQGQRNWQVAVDEADGANRRRFDWVALCGGVSEPDQELGAQGVQKWGWRS